ncbi:hypothetical protein AADG42_14330 [Ammonicoccus fulvus]|uniref:Uncharacterized protein n=1 Tax=Ammonicoccus fulvus TaxID=3138240 RepID=A0ABZ3FQT2_9ACTN
MFRFPLAVGSLAAVVLLAACGTQAPAGNPSTPTPSETIVTSTPTEPAPDETPDTGDTPAVDDELTDSTISAQGLGPIRLGMSLSEAQAHGWVAESKVCENTWDADDELLEQGASFKFHDDRLQEIWVGKPTWATDAGARVGDSADSLAEAYGSDLRTENRNSNGRDYEARYVADDGEEILFLGRSPEDRSVATIIVRHSDAPLIEGC